ncbi:MAG: TetR/AcrR family transcriptional regulator C-terminal domain-containing protein [Bulleidia sp.]
MEYHKNVMKLALSGSLRELMMKNLFEKITIKKICDHTGVIRATFYNYFDDKYDCLNWIVYHDLIDGTKEYVEKCDFGSAFTTILKTVSDNRAFYRAAYQVTGQNAFEDMVRENMSIFVKSYLDRYRVKNVLPKYDNETLARYFGEGFAFHIRVFTLNPNHTVEDMKQMMLDLLSNSFSDLIIQKI